MENMVCQKNNPKSDVNGLEAEKTESQNTIGYGTRLRAQAVKLPNECLLDGRIRSQCALIPRDKIE